MKVIGIIIESNPLHNGHKYLIDQVKKELKPDVLVALSSGYFTMRGECSILNKKNKTKLLLESGFDLVIDFPICYSLNSSSYFSDHAIEFLNKANITHLAFGVECQGLDELNQYLDVMSSYEFEFKFKANLNKKISFKKAIQNTFLEMPNINSKITDLLLKSNNTLALCYLNSLKKYPHIKPYAIKRIGNNEENLNLSSFPSGTALRTNYLDNKDISEYLPYSDNYLTDLKNYDYNYKIIIENMLMNDPSDYVNCLHVSEGIENYIFNNYDKTKTFNNNISDLANKTYSKSRIRRTILSMILRIPKSINKEKKYLRILGFSKKGQEYLRHIKNNIITNLTKEKLEIYDFEIKACKLYDILTNENNLIEEYRFPLKGE